MDPIHSAAARTLNHLLAPHGWARERLAPFAGRDIEVRAPAAPALRIRVTDGGFVEPAAPDAIPFLLVSLKPGFFFALPRGPEHLLREVEISGDAALGAEILFLARHLRWDAEEDLSRLFGDVVAHRLVGGARELASGLAEAGRRTAEAAMEYVVEERSLLVTRAEHETLARDNAQLRDGLERLEKRLERLA